VKNKQELWITNVNRFQDITLGDLAITIPRGRSINLLATKKNGLSLYNVTQKQIDKSFASGSLYKKSLHIKKREVAPEVFVNNIEVAPILDMSSSRTVRKPPEIEKLEFPDLDMEDNSTSTDEAFAAETADMEAADRAPILAVDPMFKRKTDDDY
jgi:hypothetical protein